MLCWCFTQFFGLPYGTVGNTVVLVFNRAGIQCLYQYSTDGISAVYCHELVQYSDSLVQYSVVLVQHSTVLMYSIVYSAVVLVYYGFWLYNYAFCVCYTLLSQVRDSWLGSVHGISLAQDQGWALWNLVCLVTIDAPASLLVPKLWGRA